MPAGRCAINMTIEQIINKDAKTRVGIIGFSRSLPTYYRWCATRHNRSQYISALQEITNMDSKSLDSHKDIPNSERQLKEKSVRSTVRAFSAFTNPFKISTDAFVCLSSGKKLSAGVANDMMEMDRYGKEQFESFVDSRLKHKTVAFKHPLPKSGIKTFASATNVVAVKSKTKEVKKESSVKSFRTVTGFVIRAWHRYGEGFTLSIESNSLVLALQFMHLNQEEI